jgi:hypothetical protein
MSAAPLRLGLRGLGLVVPIAALLAFGAGGAEPSLLVLGPIVTASLPLIAMVAFWWEDWPGTRLGRSWAGWADTALIAAGGVVLVAAAQAVAGGPDLRGLFDPSPGAGHVPTFPATLPLTGAAFVAMLQITLVGEGWPLRRLPALAAGPVAVVVSWALALAVYVTLVGVEGPAGSAVTARSGAIGGADLGAAIVWIGAWQVLCFVVWRGWPTARVGPRAARLACAHALVLGGGALTCLLTRLAVDASTTTAAGGCVVAAGLAVGMLFEAPSSPVRAAVATLVVAAAMLAALSALAVVAGLTGPRADDWVAHASLNAIAASIILHVAVGRRWPFA